MNKIQEILNDINKQDFSKIGRGNDLFNISNRKTYYVFHNGVLIDTVRGRRQCEKKYPNTCNILRRNRPIKGIYVSETPKYDPRVVWESLDRIQTKVLYKDGTMKVFQTQTEFGETFGFTRSKVSQIKSGHRKLPKHLSKNISKIIFGDVEYNY